MPAVALDCPFLVVSLLGKDKAMACYLGTMHLIYRLMFYIDVKMFEIYAQSTTSTQPELLGASMGCPLR